MANRKTSLLRPAGPLRDADVLRIARPNEAVVDERDAQTTLADVAAFASRATRSPRIVSAAGTHLISRADSCVEVRREATGAVTLTLPSGLTDSLPVVNYKTDAVAANALVRIVPAAPSGGGAARTIGGDTSADLEGSGAAVLLVPSASDWAVVG